MILIFLIFWVVLRCIFEFWVPCCDVRYYFRITKMFGSYLPPVVCRKAHILSMLFVFACVWWCATYSLVYPILPVSLDCLFLIAPSVFSWLLLKYVIDMYPCSHNLRHYTPVILQVYCLPKYITNVYVLISFRINIMEYDT